MAAAAPEPCKHAAEAPDSCPPTCACWCDACQVRYEDEWDRRAVAEALCGACGMPNGELTLGRLQLFQYIHFFLPCVDCAVRYKAFTQKEGLCPMCRKASEGGHVCAGCIVAAETQEAPPAPPGFRPSQGPNTQDRTSGGRAGTPLPSPPQRLPSWIEEAAGCCELPVSPDAPLVPVAPAPAGPESEPASSLATTAPEKMT
jgi:hypothetical protein